MVKVTGVEAAFVPYLESHRTPDDPLLEELRDSTREKLADLAGMQISLAQARLLSLLVASCRVERAIEIGTFTGMSALAVARALPEQGRLVACDVSEEWTAIGRSFWERAGVAHKIDLRIGPALETLESLPPDPLFDFGFIDADKKNYPAYYDALVERIRPGGLIAIDNALWGGGVLAPEKGDDSARVLAALNDRIVSDTRVEAILLPVGDGLWLVRRR